MARKGRKKRRTQRDKATCQIWHAQKRAAERFGIHLSIRDINQIIGYIQSGRSKLLKRQSNRIRVHQVWYHGQAMVVPYDRHRKTITTVMPPEYWQEQEHV